MPVLQTTGQSETRPYECWRATAKDNENGKRKYESELLPNTWRVIASSLCWVVGNLW
jgi:hypothetical protein